MTHKTYPPSHYYTTRWVGGGRWGSSARSHTHPFTAHPSHVSDLHISPTSQWLWTVL